MALQKIIVIWLTLSSVQVLVNASLGVSYTSCKTDNDCIKANTFCHTTTGICNCLLGAIRLSDNQCLPKRDMQRPPGPAGHANAPDISPVSIARVRQATDIVPDWALYTVAFLGFLGMVLIGFVAVKRAEEREDDVITTVNDHQIPLPKLTTAGESKTQQTLEPKAAAHTAVAIV